ncbi:MAG: methylated-DNA--[protein]-cysteine S-methyltransferase [Desulfovibrio sp.]|jgi:methylated-DNA-[protein]-cysteine S-methyltransferase|nr:methylated-DNA--[protein]-cysteine S-methyltransferase [Desulfovibrio sp.]
MCYSTTHPSPLGLITLASDGDNLVGLWLEGQKYHGCSLPGAMRPKTDIPVFEAAKKWLDQYFAGKKPDVSKLRLAPGGNAFRRKVWSVLREIPYGDTVTYGGIAKRVAPDGGNMSSQAVGGAVGHNPIAIIIPCHRVVGSNGSLTGYAGGIQTKIKLLALEGVDMSRLFVPKKGTAL